MRSLSLLVWPQEVVKVTNDKARKIIGEILDSSTFELKRHAAHQENPWNIRNSDLNLKLGVFPTKMFNKKIISMKNA